VAVSVSDQNSPPVLPTGDGRCVVIIRVEDGRLFKIENVFKDIFKQFLAPLGRLPVGSVVLVGSLAHLARYGLESYSIDLVKTVLSILAVVGADVVPYVPIPLGGVVDADLVRAVFDLDSSIKSGPGVAARCCPRSLLGGGR
jgi:hypothetical protein